jgi:predicted helicase
LSQLLIQQYLNNLQDLRKVSGTHRESVVREAFKDLLKHWGKSFDLIFVPEYEIETPAKERRYVDGALLHELRVPFGYWEAKDEKDDLEAEIEFKFKRGYPQDNIIFEDSREAVLYQNRQEVFRCSVENVESLQKLLNLFFGYQRPEIADFRKAVEQFKTDLPAVLKALREMIESAEGENAEFKKAASKFLKQAKEVINPSLVAADIREMLIQHILTEEVFAAVFSGTPFHQDNNVAQELYNLEKTFFVGNTKYKTLKALEPYYAAIRGAASQISSHHEKQTFLKVIYENFYKVYNVKAADRLGVVYTPNEIVRFMIEGADWLCEKHFGRNLIDKDVDILDPATGTGTFICELMEHFRGQPEKLKRKYDFELHANEVAILPYYVANLNIEATYAAIAGEYHEYPNLCFVDTLDNTFALRKRVGDHMGDLFGAVSEENVGRIRRQNARKISVVIGNPPYNANQLNENENNKNREYPEIDKRIKDTYIKKSTAQKTKVYDMYARFFRWASDRVDEDGIVAFITNRSFIDSRTFDGFRKDVAEEFDEVWIMDLGGDVRENPKLSGTKNNVFGIQTGVAISFMVKKARKKSKKSNDHKCKIFYARRPELDTKEEKLEFLAHNRITQIKFELIDPDDRGYWLDLTDTDFESLLPIASKQSKSAKKISQEKTIFKLFSLGVVTARDEWVYDFDQSALEEKVQFLIKAYNADKKKFSNKVDRENMADLLDSSIKWTRAVKNDLKNNKSLEIDNASFQTAVYRPFISRKVYFNKRLNEMQYRLAEIYGDKGTVSTPTIVFSDPTSQKPFMATAVNRIFDLHLVGAACGSVGVPFSRLENDKITQCDNITDWALEQFKKKYKSKEGDGVRKITKEDIFFYVYGVLNDPVYLEKYKVDLKKDLPRIPLYKDFWQWAGWGKKLMNIHLNFERAEKFPLRINEIISKKTKTASSKSRLQPDKSNGVIIVDDHTSLTGIPKEAWDYKLGSRSAIEWILDQYSESKPKDATIREKFDTYRFIDYKEHVIELIMRVTTVSTETMKIIEAMKKADR